MNSFFKNLITSSSTPHQQQEQKSDFQRLIELCNSYGLNEEETKQLIEEFKKRSYRSENNSLNQSMVSNENDVSMSEHDNEECYQDSQRKFSKQQAPTQQSSKSANQQPSRNTNFYHPQQTPYSHQGQSTNRFYGYSNDLQEKGDESYNEMTFNEQNHSLMMMNNSHQFYGQQSQSSKENTLRQEMKMQQRAKDRLFENNFNEDFVVEEKQLVKNNSRKQVSQERRASNQHSLQNQNSALNDSESSKNSRESISTKMVSQHVDKTSTHQSSGQQKRSQQTSKSSQNSIRQNSIEHQEAHELNHEYIRELIRNFQMLQKENDCLREHNEEIQQKNHQISQQNEAVKVQNQKYKKDLDDSKNTLKITTNEVSKLEALLQSERQKSEMFLMMKEKDSEIIKGLKDSILQLTDLVKQKDTQNKQQQQKLFELFDKLQNQSQYLAGNEFNHTGESAASSFGKSGSRKSLASGQSEKDLNVQQRVRDRTPNYGRRQLAEMMVKNINLPPHTQTTTQQKLLAREPSTSKISHPQSTPTNYQPTNLRKTPSQTLQQNRQLHMQQLSSKENIFTPLQVNPTGNRNQSSSSTSSSNNNPKKCPQDDANKKRPSSRVDIKKYKGMIEELRNSYSNVNGTSSSNMMR